MMATVFIMVASRTATLATASSAPSHLSVMGSSYYARHVDCRNNKQSRIILSQIFNDIRGGGDSGGEDYSFTPNANAYNYGSQLQQPPQEMGNQYVQSNSPDSPPAVVPTTPTEYNMGAMGGAAGANHPMGEYRETVEDRIDAWRKQQQELQQTQSDIDAANVVDDQGRLKLFAGVSRVSVSFFFFILMWRTVHHYELADSTFGSGRGNNGVGISHHVFRIVVVTPLVVLFLGEMMGAVLGIGGVSSTSHATKKRLKGILNLHKVVELVMIFYNVVRLALWPSKYVMREVYLGRTISNFFFFVQCQLYTKLSWDVLLSVGESGYVAESYYDDDTPDNAANYYEEGAPPTNGDEYYIRQGGPSPQDQNQYQQSYKDNATGWS
eukprot:CAMPEP_0181106200 /NCGR_PEP_ID=MMETSP1071-20121207/16401_1 /TAXON_ID=35127 /ORGANISM="Thalassiosira sp., Strain NH16" /LENGTH=380 /DNA_ID=CAMNT_0023189583 /DNA_START=85 /DNA_END=1227 /DNA_ORIENTATION=-